MPTLTITNGGLLGEWDNPDYCTEGNYGIGYRMRVCSGKAYDVNVTL